MTSEICVANRLALVLAADSAVTVTRWDNGKKEERYFKGANKIFQMSAFNPVGIMIFDSADLHRVPWEIILKEFRNSIARKKCGGLNEYAEAFFAFIESDRVIFTEDMRKEIFVEIVDQTVIRILHMINSDNRVSQAVDDTAKQAAREQCFSEFESYSPNWSSLIGTSFAEMGDSIANHIDSLRHEARIDLQALAGGANIDVDQLIALAGRYVLSFPEYALSATGMVVAGFGDNDYFPSYINYDCSGLLAARLLRNEKASYTVDRKSSGHINAFATKAMVDTFTMGFGPDVLEHVTSNLDHALTLFGNKLCAEVGAAVPDLATLKSEAITAHRDKWTQAVISAHTHPLQRVIGSLPIDEMVGLAETLVMLESLKEKVTQPSESVGGPIDVAIITKNEGFLWAKRKHFFSADLNPRFAFRQQELYANQREGEA